MFQPLEGQGGNGEIFLRERDPLSAGGEGTPADASRYDVLRILDAVYPCVLWEGQPLWLPDAGQARGLPLHGR
jgi:hypothetical protein